LSACVYLNGEFLPRDQARVPVMDRGFLFGDGVYEVIPAYGGRLFRLPQHLQRLRDSLTAIHIDNPLSDSQWTGVLTELLLRNGGGDQSVYLQVTRGTPQKRDHGFPEGVAPTVVAMSDPIQAPAWENDLHGLSAVTVEDIRWQYCNIKAITLLANILMRQQARDRGANEAILVRDGLATEAAAANLFLVEDDVLVTPPKGPQLLPGITRDLVVELALREGIRLREEPLPVERLAGAGEIWLTSSTREIVPVTRLNGAEVGSGRPGPLWRRMSAVYRDYKQRFREGLED